jgi:hypothetical protein
MMSTFLNKAAEDRGTFRALFVAGPFLMCSLVPSVVFGIIYDEWGSNIIWGSIFGLGWCLSAFWSGNIVHDNLSSTVGLLWAWLMPLPLFFASGWLWTVSSTRGRTVAVRVLAASFLLNLPASAMMGLDSAGIHLPDYTTHLATSY